MKLSIAAMLATVATISTQAYGFAPQSNVAIRAVQPSSALFSTMADSGVPPTSAEATTVADELIPTKLPSDVGMDYVPLATMLASGQLAEADQVINYYGIPSCRIFSRRTCILVLLQCAFISSYIALNVSVLFPSSILQFFFHMNNNNNKT